MNIYLFSSHDKGGAGTAAYLIHSNLQSKDYNSNLIVLHKSRDEESIKQVKFNKPLLILKQRKESFENKLGLFNKKYDFLDHRC